MSDKGTILAVDDTPPSLYLLTRILAANGYQVRSAGSGELALASVATSPPELILLDIQMPGIDGFEVFRLLKAQEETRDIPIVFLSASDEVGARVRGLKLGAVDFISKPFQREELLVRVQTHIEMSRLRSRLERQTADLLLANEQLAREIGERRRAEEELRSLSLRDDLTGLYNRRGFLMLAEQELRLAHRMKKGALVLFGDMDGLKIVNDTLGHSEGDQALTEIANALKETFREADIVARLGGDEFAVLAMDVCQESVDSLVNRLQERMGMRSRQRDGHHELSLSVGMTWYDPEAPRTITELLAQADSLMYQQKLAKHEGGDQAAARSSAVRGAGSGGG